MHTTTIKIIGDKLTVKAFKVTPDDHNKFKVTLYNYAWNAHQNRVFGKKSADKYKSKERFTVTVPLNHIPKP